MSLQLKFAELYDTLNNESIVKLELFSTWPILKFLPHVELFCPRTLKGSNPQ